MPYFTNMKLNEISKKFEEKCKNYQKYPTRATSKFLEYTLNYDTE